jgi:hypothetical protein
MGRLLIQNGMMRHDQPITAMMNHLQTLAHADNAVQAWQCPWTQRCSLDRTAEGCAGGGVCTKRSSITSVCWCRSHEEGKEEEEEVYPVRDSGFQGPEGNMPKTTVNVTFGPGNIVGCHSGPDQGVAEVQTGD